MLRRAGTLIVAGLLGAGAALGVAACGEERGSVTVEGGTGGTATGGTATGGTATAETATVETSPTTTEP
jgi:hypothetical protein